MIDSQGSAGQISWTNISPLFVRGLSETSFALYWRFDSAKTTQFHLWPSAKDLNRKALEARCDAVARLSCLSNSFHISKMYQYESLHIAQVLRL